MRVIITLLSIYFIGFNASFANTQDTKSNAHEGFLSAINSHKELLPESSQCPGC